MISDFEMRLRALGMRVGVNYDEHHGFRGYAEAIDARTVKRVDAVRDLRDAERICVAVLKRPMRRRLAAVGS